jgi:hypothetical protein
MTNNDGRKTAKDVELTPPLDYETESSVQRVGVEPSELDAIPVYMVGDTEPEQIIDWTAVQYSIGEQAIRIAGSRRNRKNIRFWNLGPNTAYLGRSSGVSSATGYPVIMNNGDTELQHQEEVYAICASGETAVIAIVQEFYIDLD